MKNKIMCMILLIPVMFFFACSYSGFLSEKEERYIIDYMLDENIIESDIDLVAEGVGEGELATYKADTMVNGKKINVIVKQKNHYDGYRIFFIKLYDENNNKISEYEIRVDRE